MNKARLIPFLSLVVVSAACGPQTPEPKTPPETPDPPAEEAPEPETTPEPAEPETPANSARPASWGYEGELGPSRWAELSPAYAACAEGKMQSPIDITTKGSSAKSDVKFGYGKSSLKIAHHEHVHDILDNGHTIQVTVDEGSTLTTARNTYHLKQFHFHTPSENTVDGKNYPMEMHMVHQAEDGAFAVVALFFSPGKENAQLGELIANFPAAVGEDREFPDKQIDLRSHLPPKLDTRTYVGSFTTPPCTESVEWIVLAAPIAASEAQLTAFSERLKSNNRPVQPLNGRTIGAATATVAQ